MKLKVSLLSAVFASACFAQSPFIIGVRGGVPLNTAIQIANNNGNFSSASNDYVVGPTIGVRLPLGFSVALDALYTGLSIKATGASTGSGVSTGLSASAASWEFPVLARYTAGHGFVAPFVGAGVSVRHLGDFGNVGSFVTNSSSSTVTSSTGIGFAIDGGLQFKVGPLHLSPEIRYTHWGSNQISNAFSSVFHTNSDEAQVLVGLTF